MLSPSRSTFKSSTCTFALLALSVAVLGSNCSSSKTEKQISQSPERYRTIALQRFNGNAEFYTNKSQSHVLCIQRVTKSRSGSAPLSFFVYDISRQAIVFERTGESGTATWQSDDIVAVDLVPGIVSGKDSSETDKISFTFNVRTGEVVRQTSELLKR